MSLSVQPALDLTAGWDVTIRNVQGRTLTPLSRPSGIAFSDREALRNLVERFKPTRANLVAGKERHRVL